VLGFAIVAIGWLACDDEIPQRLPPHISDGIQVSRVEPGRECALVGVVEGESRASARGKYESAFVDVQDAAAMRGGNYVVIDAVDSIYGDGTGREIVIRGRLFSCALGLPAAMVRAESTCR
jgi:hypothetical protein